MWKSACCLACIFVLSLVGVAIDILMTETGEDDFAIGNREYDIKAYVTYTSTKIEMTVKVNGDKWNDTQSITYKKAYQELCKDVDETDTDDCKDLKNVRDAGKQYIAWSIIGIVFIAIACGLSIFVTIGKCLCKCRCPFRYVIALLTLIGMVCFIIAFGVFLNGYADNLNDILDYLFAYYFPLSYVALDWNDAIAGPSIILSILSASLSMMAMAIILCLDRHNDRSTRSVAEEQARQPLTSGGEGQFLEGQPNPDDQRVTRV